MKKFFTVALILSVTFLHAQIIKLDSPSYWKKAFKVGLNFNQASFTSNWKAGGVNSLGFNTLMNCKANYKKEKVTWDNELDLLYGMVNNAGQGYRKTFDRIYMDTKYGITTSKKWNIFTAINVQSQFAKGYKYLKDVNDADSAVLISNKIAPAFITGTIGFQYQVSPAFKIRISPIAPRLTIVQNSELYTAVDPVAPYGVKIGETTRFEWAAAQVLAEFDKNISANLNLKWRYLLFANYSNFNFNEIDHRLDFSLVVKVTKFVNVNFGGIVLYDHDQDAGIQVAESFSLGVLYVIQNYRPEK